MGNAATAACIATNICAKRAALVGGASGAPGAPGGPGGPSGSGDLGGVAEVVGLVLLVGLVLQELCLHLLLVGQQQ